ncbi:MAG: LysR family transcriptional regulator [Candidatus Sericytochromatia bacterium]
MSLSINIEWLYSFIAVAKTENFIKASNDLYITPQAISYHIKSLEKHLKIRLLKRNKNNNSLTNEGKLFFEKISFLLENYENELNNIKKIEIKEEIIILQTNCCNFDYLIASIINNFYNNLPNTKIKIFSVFSNDLEEEMLKNNINIALSTKKIVNKNFENKLLIKIPLVIVSKIIDDWKELNYLSANYHPIRKTKNKNLLEDEYNLETFADVASLNPAIELCKRGLGAMYVPLLSVEKELREKKLNIIHTNNLIEEYEDFFIIIRKNIKLSKQENLFLDLVKEEIKKYNLRAKKLEANL